MDGQWDKCKVERLLNTEEAQVVLTIPLSRRPSRDKLIWHYTKCGKYLTCSGYRCDVDMRSNGELGRRGSGGCSRGNKLKIVGREFGSSKCHHMLNHLCGNVCTIYSPQEIDFAVEEFLWKAIVLISCILLCCVLFLVDSGSARHGL
ncbi:hypothetical protein LIER_36319 [Lithospermum erythrorhizon]|uniref:Uncharacterized protein n=1 Tax=Lithospermum erythrorhizon TaxID=34254 RepID=A0AAV3P4Q0_LITER